MGAENPSANTIEQETAHYWKRMQEFLPSELSDQEKKWVRRYVKVRVAIQRKDFMEVNKNLAILDKSGGYILFEDGHQELFAAIEKSVNGSSNRKDYLEKEITPLFKFKEP